MSTGAVIAAIIWSLILVVLIAILSAEARRRRDESRRRRERASRRQAIPRADHLQQGAPEGHDRTRMLDSAASDIGESEVREHRAA